MQTAIFGLVILGEPVSSLAAVAIAISLVGVMSISVAKSHLTLRNLLLGWTGRAAFIGILSGTFFGLSAVAYRAAALSLGGEGFLMQAAFTLACVIVFQTAVMGVWIRVREPGELTRVFRGWRVASLVGVAGMIGSVGWFTAMTIENAAYVRAVGQVELVFTFIASYFFFRERSTASRDRGDPPHRRGDRHPAPRLTGPDRQPARGGAHRPAVMRGAAGPTSEPRRAASAPPRDLCPGALAPRALEPEGDVGRELPPRAHSKRALAFAGEPEARVGCHHPETARPAEPVAYFRVETALAREFPFSAREAARIRQRPKPFDPRPTPCRRRARR